MSNSPSRSSEYNSSSSSEYSDLEGEDQAIEIEIKEVTEKIEEKNKNPVISVKKFEENVYQRLMFYQKKKEKKLAELKIKVNHILYFLICFRK